MIINRFKYPNPEFASRITISPLSGPFKYDKATIEKEIPEKVIGNYILGSVDENGYFDVRYVGRSDSDLKTRIGHEIDRYSHFMFSIADSAREAYYQECLMWHLYGGDKGELDNKIHPDKPDGDSRAECFICKMIKEMQ